MPGLDRLPEAVLSRIFSHVDDPRRLGLLQVLSRRICDVITQLQSSVTISLNSTAELDSILARPLVKIKRVTFENFDESVPEDGGLNNLRYKCLLLMQKIGSGLQELLLNNVSSDHHDWIFNAVTSHSSENLTIIGISSDDISDSHMALLCKSCPNVELFAAEEAAVSESSVFCIGQKWRKLASLDVGTARLSTEPQSPIWLLNNQSLTRLSVTHFRFPFRLQSFSATSNSPTRAFSAFLDGLKRFPNLTVLAIDVSNTPHFDGLTSAEIKDILDSCPNLQGFEFCASFDSYFNVDEEEEANQRAFFGQQIPPLSVFAASSADMDQPPSTPRRALGAGLELFSRSRRGSVGSMSMMTVNTINTGTNLAFYASRPFHSPLPMKERDDPDTDDDVTSLAPAIPSPNPLGPETSQVLGLWVSDDKQSLRVRAERMISEEGRLLTTKLTQYLTILDDIATLCKERKIKSTIAWSA